MFEAKRGPGRPPKVRPEAEVIDREWLADAAAKLPPAVKAERMIEVELIRKYAPDGQPQEIKQTVPAGTVVQLPVLEATRLLKFGYAHATDKTFG